MITEFCDTRDKNGIVRKYSAFFIRGRIIPRHLFFGYNWCLKHAQVYENDLLEEEVVYLKNNTHENELKPIFRMARIDYGRIDYGIKDGDIQVWEINTNPNILTRDMLKKSSLRYGVHQKFRVHFKEALNELNNIQDRSQDKLSIPFNIVFVYKRLIYRFIRIKYPIIVNNLLRLNLGSY